MKIALTSMDICYEDEKKNMEICRLMVREAKLQKAEIIIFPEMTLTGFSMNMDIVAKEQENDEAVNFFKSLSKDYEIAIIFGMVRKKHDKKCYNQALMTDGDRILFEYEKIHPFSNGGEDKYIEKGNHIVNAEYGKINISCFICYDLRFPEIFQKASKKADIIFVVANWPKVRIDHFNTLLKARAIENQCYVAGINRCGKDENIQYTKSSKCFDPLGNIIYKKAVQVMDENMITVLDISPEVVKKVREDFGVKKDRREEFYKSI